MLARKLKWARASRVGAEVELSMTILHALLHAPASRVIRQLLSPLSDREVASLEGGDASLVGNDPNFVPAGIGAGANAFGIAAGSVLLVLAREPIPRVQRAAAMTDAERQTAVSREASPAAWLPVGCFRN